MHNSQHSYSLICCLTSTALLLFSAKDVLFLPHRGPPATTSRSPRSPSLASMTLRCATSWKRALVAVKSSHKNNSSTTIVAFSVSSRPATTCLMWCTTTWRMTRSRFVSATTLTTVVTPSPFFFAVKSCQIASM